MNANLKPTVTFCRNARAAALSLIVALAAPAGVKSFFLPRIRQCPHDSPDVAVRTAALGVLGAIDDATALSVLTRAATSGDPAEQRATRVALVELRQAGAGAEMVMLMRQTTPAVRMELARALAARGERSVIPASVSVRAVCARSATQPVPSRTAGWGRTPPAPRCAEGQGTGCSNWTGRGFRTEGNS